MLLSGAPRWRGGHHPMGDAKSGPVRLWFNRQLRVEFHGATVTSDAGLLLARELDERLGLSTLTERHLADPRTGRNYQFSLPDLFRQSIYSRLAGYEDTNDAERLAEDPTFRMLASRERRDTSVALTSTLHWFETDVLAEEQNYQGLTRLNTELVQHPAARSLSRRGILDIDSSQSPVPGTQEPSAYNGPLWGSEHGPYRKSRFEYRHGVEPEFIGVEGCDHLSQPGCPFAWYPGHRLAPK